MSREQALRLLSLTGSPTSEEIRKAYKKKSKKYHPDIAGADSTHLFIAIKEAYDYLMKNIETQGGSKKPIQSGVTHSTIISVVGK